MAVMPAEPRASPPDPSLHVQPKPGGGVGLARLSLVKLEGTCNEPGRGLLGRGTPSSGGAGQGASYTDLNDLARFSVQPILGDIGSTQRTYSEIIQ